MRGKTYSCRVCGCELTTDIEINYRECEGCTFDRYEAEQPEREQRRREQLDAEGYYDDPAAWQKRKTLQRKAVEVSTGPHADDLLEICHSAWDV